MNEMKDPRLKKLSARDTITYFLIKKSKLSVADARLLLQHVRDEAEAICRWLDAQDEDSLDVSGYELKARIFKNETLENVYEVLMLYIGGMEFDLEETLAVLQMVESELQAMETRKTFSKVPKGE